MSKIAEKIINKGKIMLAGLLIGVCLSAVSVLTVFAEKEEALTETTKEILSIATVEEFLAFAENCRLDSYSQGLTVELKADIDLTGVDFSGIPIFCGSFEGRGYSIKGLNIAGKGSAVGLFRYLEREASVRDLTVCGEVIPSGSRCIVGGIAGVNRGEIENCSFAGTVSGVEFVGGIAGSNEVTGMIEDCHTQGKIQGNHFVGGVAGQNLGLICRSTNHSGVNTTAAQNAVDISDITMDILTGSESVAAVTDMGGIAGGSAGVIRDCINHGNVGYPSMGYNIGGIAGSLTGYLSGSTNYGEINGRKEVGGIVGQMEPAALIEYEEDTLQILTRQLLTMNEILDRIAANTETNLTGINNQIGVLRAELGEVKAALEVIMEETAKMSGDRTEGEDTEDPVDMDRLSAALSELTGSVDALGSGIQRLLDLTQRAGVTLGSDLDALTRQMDAINSTLDGASDHVGGSITDVSDSDTEDDLTCKVEDCVNYGAVSADLNVGGIAGAIAPENDLDPEDDLEVSGDLSLNFSGKFRAVIADCSNQGVITAKKQRIGGIVGRMALGLVKDSQNRGRIAGPGADYVGGIAGESRGYIRRCDVKAEIAGTDYVGGIAGTGEVVSDCRSMVLLAGAEKTGAVLGYTEQSLYLDGEPAITGNYYLVVDTDRGAIDGISYSNGAEPMDPDAFLAQEGLPGFFLEETVRFADDQGFEEIIRVKTGGTIDMDQIPAVPERSGYVGRWENADGELPDEQMMTDIRFDMVFEAVYVSKLTVIRSEQTDENGLPLLLAEGIFYDEKRMELTKLKKSPELLEGERLISGWEICFPEEAESTTLRYLIPEEYRDKDLKLMVRLTGRVWNEEPFTVDGRYLVFIADAEDDAFCLVERPADYRVIWYGAAGAAVAILIGVWIIVRKHHKTKRRA